MCPPPPLSRRTPVIVVQETAKYLASQSSYQDPQEHPPAVAQLVTI